jgi:ankyrin repeat protein
VSRRGADVDVADTDGNTALHLAAAANARLSMALLVASPLKPAVDQRNCGGETPLLLGARAGAAECCALLLSPGGADASLRLRAAPFATATDLALRGRHPAVVAALRRWGGA